MMNEDDTHLAKKAKPSGMSTTSTVNKSSVNYLAFCVCVQISTPWCLTNKGMHAANGNTSDATGHRNCLSNCEVNGPLSMYLINTNGLGVVPHTDSYGFVIGKKHHNKAQILTNLLHGLQTSVAFVTETHEYLSPLTFSILMFPPL